MSARIGANPLLIQAAGGNSSIKDGDTLWVKASGLWLRDALTRPMFVPVALDQVRERVHQRDPDPVGPALLLAIAPPGLRPSIETTLHALMPQRVVLHVHSVDAIAWGLLPEAETQLQGVLKDFRWIWVDYQRPGLPLTHAVAEALAARPADVVMMANHGLVVGGDSVTDAEQRLRTVVDRLRRPVRSAPAGDAEGLARDGMDTGWRLPSAAQAHAIATDPLNLARAERGVLYPDHVVFLGHRVTSAPAQLDGDALREWLKARRAADPAPPFVAIAGRGVLVRDDLGDAAQELLGCLADVLQRLPQSPEPRLLPESEALALANWEAEQFRLKQQR